MYPLLSYTSVMQKELRAIVRGRVQMVMYRDFAQRSAKRLKLVGTVQNLKDGTVAVVAQGEEEALKRYVEKLHKGSVLSRVEGVEVEWSEPKEVYTRFTITY
jgi:acylphosphatase